MKIIQALIVFLLLSVSTSALAKGSDKEQMLVTPPLAGGTYYQVIYANKSGHELDLAVQFFDGSGAPYDIPWDQTSPDGGTSWLAWVVNYGATYTHVTWFGSPDDLMVTVCSLDDFASTTVFKACLRAN